MMARRGVLEILLAGATFAMTSGCRALNGGTPDFRYRFTVEIDTPEGLKSGSSVIEVSRPGYDSPTWRGQAAIIDLASRGKAFALLRANSDEWSDGVNWALNTMGKAYFDSLSDEERAAYFKKSARARDGEMFSASGQVYTLPRHFMHAPDTGFRHKLGDTPSAYPMLVFFRDITDPKSVEKIDPDNMGAALGSGVALRRITVQLTDDDVTTGIEKVLPWWSRHRGIHLDESSMSSEDMTSANIAAHLSSGSFSTEYRK